MATIRPPSSATLLGVIATLAIACAPVRTPAAEGGSAQQGVNWRADVLSSNLAKEVLELEGNVRLAQGPTSITASQARVDAFRSDNSRWTFQRSVIIRTAEAELRSNVAKAAFANGAIADAHVEGTPAEFQQLNPKQADRQIRGRAGVIEYDIANGVVTLTGNVWFGYGKDEFRGDTVIYSIHDQTVRVNPGGKSPGGVRGTLRPPDRSGKKPAMSTQKDPAGSGE
jgi:lipopolysaccharide transport protein LptA